jgi:hypothetical protein
MKTHFRHVNFTWGTGRLMPRGRDFISIRWTGVFMAKWPRTYFAVKADGHARLWVNGDLILDHCMDCLHFLKNRAVLMF